MFEIDKRKKLNRLYAELEKYKGKKDQYSINQAKKIRLEIRDTKNIMTTEDFQEMMESRSEIDTRKC